MPKKMTDRTPSETLLRLLIFLLERDEPVTLKELANKLEISKQSVLKYLDRMDLSYFGSLDRQKQGREVIYTFKPNMKKIRKLGKNLPASTILFFMKKHLA